MLHLVPDIVSPPLVFSPSLVVAQTSVTSDTTRSGYTIVDKYLPAAFSAVGTTIRLTIQGPALGTGTLNAVYIGQAATSGNAWNYDGGQVQVTFSNSAAVSFIAGQSIVSDQITFTIDKSKAILVAYNVGSSTTLRKMSSLNTTNFISYVHSALQEAGSTSKTASYTAATGTSYITSQIEVA